MNRTVVADIAFWGMMICAYVFLGCAIVFMYRSAPDALARFATIPVAGLLLLVPVLVACTVTSPDRNAKR